MSLDYGMKVSKPGISVLTATSDQLIFSSKFTTLRVATRGSGTILHSTGRTHTIAHNLGYVPVFIVHGTTGEGNTTNYFQLPYSTENFTTSASKAFCWADSTNLYIKVADNYLWETHYSNDSGYEGAFGYVRGVARIGEDLTTYGDCDCAMRFTFNVSHGEHLYECNLHYWVEERYGSSNMYMKLWGIDEDNTGDFGSDPMGRSQTTAYHRPEGNVSAGNFWQFGVKEAAQEVIDRNSWSTNLGFTFRRNGEMPSGNGVADYDNSVPYAGKSYLRTLTTNTLLNYKYTIFKDKIE